MSRKRYGRVIIIALTLLITVISNFSSAPKVQAQAIVKTVSFPVLSLNWDSGIIIPVTTQVTISASGSASLGVGQPDQPSGDQNCIAGPIDPNASENYPAPGLHCFALLGKIDNGAYFEIGAQTTQTLPAGKLYLMVNDYHIGDNDPNGFWTVTIQYQTPTIDLQTLDIHSLQPLVAGTNPTFRADIRNNGSVASGNFNIRWIADGTIFDGGHYSIPAGATDTHDHIWNNITPGNHTLTFIANFDHGIIESDYSNNQFTLTFTVNSTPPTPVPPPTPTPPPPVCVNGHPNLQSALPPSAKGKAHCIILTKHQTLTCSPVTQHCRWLETNFPVNDPHYVVFDQTTNTWYSPQPSATATNCNNWCNQGYRQYGNHTHIGIRTKWANTHLTWILDAWYLFYQY